MTLCWYLSTSRSNAPRSFCWARRTSSRSLCSVPAGRPASSSPGSRDFIDSSGGGKFCMACMARLAQLPPVHEPAARPQRGRTTLQPTNGRRGHVERRQPGAEPLASRGGIHEQIEENRGAHQSRADADRRPARDLPRPEQPEGAVCAGHQPSSRLAPGAHPGPCQGRDDRTAGQQQQQGSRHRTRRHEQRPTPGTPLPAPPSRPRPGRLQSPGAAQGSSRRMQAMIARWDSSAGVARPTRYPNRSGSCSSTNCSECVAFGG